MNTDFFEKVAQTVDDLPSLPTTVANVMRVINNSESSAKDLMQAVLADQSMCVAILKLANSAYYGQTRKISTIDAAITVLGFAEIQNIVLGRSMLSSFSGVLNQNLELAETFWEHSFTTALAARLLAEHCDIPKPGEFFIGGLIHDVGKLAMYLTAPEEYSAEIWLAAFSEREKYEEEKLTFGTTHTGIAEKLLQKWEFPQRLLEAVTFHHTPEESTDNGQFAILLQTADALSHICCTPKDTDCFNVAEELLLRLPEIDKTWKSNALPWDTDSLELWYNWLVIEKEHGSAVLAMLLT